jgi:glycosyltransferase involved in cell wall biosynthesis
MECLDHLGHKVDLLGSAQSQNPFGKVFHPSFFKERDFNEYDVVHFHQQPSSSLINQIQTPYVVTVHGNSKSGQKLDINSIFVSENHARRHHSTAFVHNGLNWEKYPEPDFKKSRDVHFLGNAAWKVKNVKGAIDLVHRLPRTKLDVMGGNRISWKMGVRIHTSRLARFHGMIDDIEKSKILNSSAALLFPVRWHEPFGLSIIESMYFGCPVFGTTYGSLPELVQPEHGFLSNSPNNWLEPLLNRDNYNTKLIHSYARDRFNAMKMTKQYITYYEKVINGTAINTSVPYAAESKAGLLPWG